MSLQYGILGLLTYAPMNGYQLNTLFGKSIKHIWTASLSQIYRELKSLEKNDMVTAHKILQEDRPDKKMYILTPKGRNAFEDWLKTPIDKAISEKRDGFMLRVFFGANLDKKYLLKHFKVFLSEIEKYEKSTDKKSMQEYKELREQVTKNLPEGAEISENQDELYLKFTLRRVELTMQMLKQWAKECLDELEELK